MLCTKIDVLKQNSPICNEMSLVLHQASFRVSKLSFHVSRHFCVLKAQQTITQKMADQGRSEILSSFNHNPLRY